MNANWRRLVRDVEYRTEERVGRAILYGPLEASSIMPRDANHTQSGPSLTESTCGKPLLGQVHSVSANDLGDVRASIDSQDLARGLGQDPQLPPPLNQLAIGGVSGSQLDSDQPSRASLERLTKGSDRAVRVVRVGDDPDSRKPLVHHTRLGSAGLVGSDDALQRARGSGIEPALNAARKECVAAGFNRGFHRPRHANRVLCARDGRVH